MAGINLSIFKNTKNPDGALKFVKFMTSKEQQKTLDKPFTALPVVKGGTAEFTDSKQEAKTFQDIWRPSPSRSRWCRPRRVRDATSATPMNSLVAQAATGKPVTDGDVKAALQEAQDKMAASGS